MIHITLVKLKFPIFNMRKITLITINNIHNYYINLKDMHVYICKALYLSWLLSPKEAKTLESTN